MLSETLENGLRQYGIGKKIRDLRAAKNIGLVELGDHTGLSSGMLSKIERGRVFPTLPTLLRIALVFGVGLEHFFADANASPARFVVRKADRIRMPDRTAPQDASYEFESLDYTLTDRKLEGFLAHFQARETPAPCHEHAGFELIYMISGRLCLTLAEDEVVLEEGDSIQFDSSFAHGYRRLGDAECTAVVVVCP